MMGPVRSSCIIILLCLSQYASAQERQTFENASWQQRDSMITTLYQSGALQVVGVMIEDAYNAERSIDTLSEAFAVFSLWQGVKNLTEQNLVDAERFLNESIETFAKLPEKKSGRYLDALLNMADLQSQLQNGAELLHYRDRALEELENDLEGQEILYHETLLESLDDAIDYGEYEKAQEYGRKALRFAQETFSNQSDEYFQSLVAVGKIYLSQGEDRRASNLILQAYELAKRYLPADHINRVFYGNNAVNILKRLGRYTAAEETYQEILQFFEENTSQKNEKIYPAVLDEIGAFYEELGDVTKAYEYYEKANVLFALRLERTDPLYIKSQLNVGNILRKQAKYTEAEVYYQDALEHSLNLYGEKNWSEATLRDNLGTIYYELGQYEQSLSERLKVKEIAEFVWGPNHQEFAYALLSLGKTYEKLDRIDEATENLETAFTKFTQLFGKNNYRVYESAKELASFYEEIDPGSALEKYEVAAEFIIYYMQDILPLFSESDRKEFTNDFNKLISRYSAFTLQNQSQLPKASQSLHNLLLAYKSVSQIPDLASISAYFANPSPELRKTYGQWQIIRQKIVSAQSKTIAEQKQDEFELTALIEDIKRVRQDILPVFKSNSFSSATQVEFGLIKSKIDANAGIIDFYQVLHYNKIDDSYQDNGSYLAFITPGRSSDTRLVKIQLNRNILQTEQITNQSDYYEQIWKPIEEDIIDSDKIIICPDGFLNKVSFYALPTKGDELLIEEHEIVIYQDLARYNSASPVTDPNRVLMFGSADFYDNVADSSEMPSLILKINPDAIATETVRNEHPISQPSASNTEINILSSYLAKKKKQVEIRNGKAANKINLYHLLENDRWPVIQLSVPMFFVPSSDSTGLQSKISSFQSGLALAGSQSTWKTGILEDEVKDDGLITAEEIYNLNLAETQLIVLPLITINSTTPGSALFNINKAFLDSGADKLIYTLWPIAETDRIDFLELFYKYLLKSNSVDDAFQKAQSKFRKKKDPRIWGGIILSN